MSGGALDPDGCRLEWNHDDRAVVGTSSVATLHLVRHNFAPYERQRSDRLWLTVTHTPTGTLVPHQVEPATPSQLRLSFTARQTGTYSLHVRLNGRSLAGTPVNRTFLAAERRRGSWGLLSVFEDCLRFLLRPPPQQQQRGGGATLGHTPSDQQGQTPECDPGRCRLEWNQDDGAPVGGASVMTLLVSIYRENCQINQFASS
jgi:hypothetical protein